MSIARGAAGTLCLLLLAVPSPAQDLDPRAYVNVPVNGTFLVAGFAVSHGAVVTDPSLPLTDINATVETPSARGRALVRPVRQDGPGVRRPAVLVCPGVGQAGGRSERDLP